MILLEWECSSGATFLNTDYSVPKDSRVVFKGNNDIFFSF